MYYWNPAIAVWVLWSSAGLLVFLCSCAGCWCCVLLPAATVMPISFFGSLLAVRVILITCFVLCWLGAGLWVWILVVETRFQRHSTRFFRNGCFFVKFSRCYAYMWHLCIFFLGVLREFRLQWYLSFSKKKKKCLCSFWKEFSILNNSVDYRQQNCFVLKKYWKHFSG